MEEKTKPQPVRSDCLPKTNCTQSRVQGEGVLRWHSPGINKCCIGNLDAYL